jgi:2-oxoglutarate/2-oxoacid ferredoxin oxidoreductase subunit alpha
MDKFTFMIGGPAGAGILNTGLQLFAKTCLRNGLSVFTCAEYPSLIRGGHNHLAVSVSNDEIFSSSREINLLVALDKLTVDEHMEDVKGGVIYDSSSFTVDLPEDILSFPIPLKEISEKNGSVLYRNTVAIGAAFGLMGIPLKEMEKIIKDKFSKKGDEVVDGNIKSARDGWDFVLNKPFPFKLAVGDKDQILLNGNDAVVLGAIKAGCKFISAYPMTPATSVLTGMARYSRAKGIVVKHTEDEIASINMAIGAGFAGARAMTCTSGGGFALMAEGLGLAAQTETPVVIVESQRPGPGTGMATRTGQGDLNFMLNASTDEFPRVVIAPGDVKECYYYIQQAFNIAEKYQMPVVLLLDKFLSTSCQSVVLDKDAGIQRGKIADKLEKRYEITQDGVSPRTLPGNPNGIFIASSYEHNEHGVEDESRENRIKMHDKRYKKLETLAEELPEPKLFGDSDFIVISWGSTKGIVREADKILKDDNSDFTHLFLPILSPFPKKVFEKLKGKKLIVVENNKTSQLSDLIAKETGRVVDHKILKYDGRQFNPEDLSRALREVMATGVKEVILSKRIMRRVGE